MGNNWRIRSECTIVDSGGGAAAAGTSETHGNGVKYLCEKVFSRSGLCAREMGAYWCMDGWMDGWMIVGAARVGREGDTDDGERVTAGECGGRAEWQPRLAPGRPTDP